MKFLLLAPFVALAAAGGLDMGFANLPSCGTEACILPAFNSSGCDYPSSFSGDKLSDDLTKIDVTCLCASSAVREAVECVKEECSQTETDRYFNFANLACMGKEGFPISQEELKTEEKSETQDSNAASGLAVNLGLVVAVAGLVAGLV